MVKPTKKTGWLASQNIYQDEFFESDSDILGEFKKGEVYQCSKCDEIYTEEEVARQCCSEEDYG